MPTTADAVIIGGGVTGTSLAYHLAKAGLQVVLLEKKHCAPGARENRPLSCGCTTRTNRKRPGISKFKAYSHFADAVGGNCGFVGSGVLWLVDHGNIENLKANVMMHQRVGVNTRVVSPQEVRDIEPVCSLGIGVGAYEPDSGYADPLLTTFAFAQRAKELGADLREGLSLEYTPPVFASTECKRVPALLKHQYN